MFQDFPIHYHCILTGRIFRNPVICSDGHTYEYSAIKKRFNAKNFTSPYDDAVQLDPKTTVVNLALMCYLYQHMGWNLPERR
jgi:hypothetical protein